MSKKEAIINEGHIKAGTEFLEGVELHDYGNFWPIALVNGNLFAWKASVLKEEDVRQAIQGQPDPENCAFGPGWDLTESVRVRRPMVTNVTLGLYRVMEERELPGKILERLSNLREVKNV